MATDADQYRNEWATRLHKQPEDIYVPLALRDPEPPASTDNIPCEVITWDDSFDPDHYYPAL